MTWLLLALNLANPLPRDTGTAKAPDELPQFDATFVRPSIDATRTIWVDDAGVAKGFQGRLTGGWAYQPLVWRYGDGQSSVLVDHAATADLSAAMGLGRLRVGVEAPLYLWTTGTLADGAGLGDVAADVKVAFVRQSPLNVAVDLRATAPTATVDAPYGSTGPTFEGTAIFDGTLGRSLLALDAGVHVGPKSDLGNIEQYGDFAVLRGGASLRLRKGAGVSGELGWRLTFGEPVTHSEANPLVAMVGAYRPLPRARMVLRGAVGTGLTRGVGSPLVQVMVGGSWEPTRSQRVSPVAFVDAPLALVDAPVPIRVPELPLPDAPIPFDAGSAELGPDALRRVSDVAVWMLSHPDRARVVVEGYPDAGPAASGDVSLGRKRADAVVVALEAAGVSAWRVRAVDSAQPVGAIAPTGAVVVRLDVAAATSPEDAGQTIPK